MKVMKRALTLLMTACLIVMMTVPVMAAGKAYTYTVRIYAGAQGTIGGSSVMTYTNLNYGDRITFNNGLVSLNDGSKYYVRGLRESGRDAGESLVNGSFAVTGDQDYVVAYGLKANSVAYTVRYVTADGTVLAEEETFYGNVGDKPVVAYRYIEGYMPQAYNMTGTLSADAASNVFTFTYTPDPEDTVTYITVNGEQVATTNQPAANQPGGAGAEGNVGEGNEDGDEGTGTVGGEGAEGNTEEGNEGGNGPQELEDIDEQEAPLANNPSGSSGTTPSVGSSDFATFVGNMPAAAKIGICSAVVLIVGAAAWLLLIRKKNKKR